jgi:DNA-3-methyladenine glycosylase II
MPHRQTKQDELPMSGLPKMTARNSPLIDHDEALDQALAALLEANPALQPLYTIGGRPPLRKRAPGFKGLAGLIVSQQVSTASAAAIWKRVEERFPALDVADMLGSDDATLQACGLSRPKIRTLRAIAAAVDSGQLDFDRLGTGSVEQAFQTLVAVKGIGPWTADLYLLFCLGHADAFPGGDLALQEAARMGFDLSERPSAQTLTELAEAWRPWRGVAAKLLWAYYGAMKRRIGEPS